MNYVKGRTQSGSGVVLLLTRCQLLLAASSLLLLLLFGFGVMLLARLLSRLAPSLLGERRGVAFGSDLSDAHVVVRDGEDALLVRDGMPFALVVQQRVHGNAGVVVIFQGRSVQRF